MPIYYDKSRKRWRYEFSRIVGGQRQRTTKLLPKEWSREDAQAYASEQDGRLFAVATGAVKHRPLISEALLLYLTEHAPSLKNQAILTRELAQCEAAYRGRYIDELADVARFKTGMFLVRIQGDAPDTARLGELANPAVLETVVSRFESGAGHHIRGVPRRAQSGLENRGIRNGDGSIPSRPARLDDCQSGNGSAC